MVSVEVLGGRAGFAKIAGEWEVLAGHTFTSVFQQPAWFEAWLDVYPPSKVAVVTARDGGRLVGVLPLGKVRNDARGMYLSQVTLFAQSDYQPLLVAPEYLEAVLPQLLDKAFQHFGKRGVYWFPNIPATDPSLEVLRRFLADRGMPYFEQSEVAPRLRLEGRDFETLEKAWKSSHRIDVRRQRKRLAEQQGSMELWEPSSIEEGIPVLREFFKVHDEKWLAQGYPGRFQDPKQQELFLAIWRRLFGKGVHFSTVRCGTLDVSYGFGFSSGGWLEWFRPTYRSEFHNLSPSKIHIALLLEKGCREGWQGMDFLLGEEPYKLAWANEQMTSVSVQAGFSELSPTYFWFSKGKPYVRKKLASDYMKLQAAIQKWKKGPVAEAAPAESKPDSAKPESARSDGEK
jgi:CelD/BcsL family acetyltransferase involved in cellulose biosynthesis